MKMRPFKSELQQVIVVSDEFVLIFGIALLFALYFKQYEADPAYKICLCIIGVVVLSFVKNLSVIIVLAVRSAYCKFRTWVHKKLGADEQRRLRLKREREQEQKELEDKNLDQLDFSHDESLTTARPSSVGLQDSTNTAINTNLLEKSLLALLN